MCNQECSLSFRQAQAVDRIGSRTHRRALGEGTGHQPCRKAWIQSKRLGDGNGSCKASDGDHDCQKYRFQPVTLQCRDELRSDGIADAEQEEQEQERFGHPRDRHMGELPDEKAGKESARHRAEAERPDLEVADPVARADHQEKRELRIADEELLQPG
jgi:hypothetical protein